MATVQQQIENLETEKAELMAKYPSLTTEGKRAAVDTLAAINIQIKKLRRTPL